MTVPCVFVTGVWKSGNHLAYSALNELGIPGPFNGVSAHLLFGKHAWAKRVLRSPRGKADAIQVGLETDAMVSRNFITKEVKRLSGKILGGHAAYSTELHHTLLETGARMICIRRDPRDILVSFADWIGSRPDFYLHRDFVDLSQTERIGKLLRGGRGTGYYLRPFTEVLQRAEGWRKAQGVLQISFEDLIGSEGGGDSGLQASVVSEIHSHVDAPKPLSEINPESIYGGTLTFNKGQSQRWRSIDDETIIAQIEETLGPSLSIWGYKE